MAKSIQDAISNQNGIPLDQQDAAIEKVLRDIPGESETDRNARIEKEYLLLLGQNDGTEAATQSREFITQTSTPSENNYIIRQAHEPDAIHIARLEDLLFRHLFERPRTTEDEATGELVWAAFIQEPTSNPQDPSEIPIAAAWYRVFPPGSPNGSCIYLDELFTKSEHRGNHLADKLVWQMISGNYIDRQSAIRPTVYTYASIGAIPFYTKLGFLPEADTIFSKEGCDFERMRLPLTPEALQRYLENADATSCFDNILESLGKNAEPYINGVMAYLTAPEPAAINENPMLFPLRDRLIKVKYLKE